MAYCQENMISEAYNSLFENEIFFAQNQGRSFVQEISGPDSETASEMKSELLAAKAFHSTEEELWSYLLANSPLWSDEFRANPKQTYDLFSKWQLNTDWHQPE